MLSQTIFAATGLGTFDAGAFQLDTAANDAGDRNGAGTQLLFAQVTGGTALTNADFQIVG